MAGRIEGQVAVVTGGCSGIGLATVNRFVEEGAKVVIGDIDDERGRTLVGQLGGADVATYVHVDVTDKDEVDALFATGEGRPTARSTSPSTTPASARRTTTRSSTPTSTPGGGCRRST